MKIIVIDMLENHTTIFERNNIYIALWCLKLIKSKVLIMMMMICKYILKVATYVFRLDSERTISFCLSEDFAVPQLQSWKKA